MGEETSTELLRYDGASYSAVGRRPWLVLFDVAPGVSAVPGQIRLAI